MRRFRLRRLWRVNCEALMRAAGQNLKRLLKKRGWGRRPWPQGAAHAFAEPPPEDHLHLRAPMRTEKALTCEEHLHVKDPLKLASSLEPVSTFHASSWIPLSSFRQDAPNPCSFGLFSAWCGSLPPSFCTRLGLGDCRSGDFSLSKLSSTMGFFNRLSSCASRLCRRA